MKLHLSRRSILNCAGIVILIIGLGFGRFLYRKSIQVASPPDYQTEIVLPENSRIYQRNVAMYEGTFGLIADQWTRDFVKLGQPRHLSIIITVVTIIAAGCCFKAAFVLNRS